MTTHNATRPGPDREPRSQPGPPLAVIGPVTAPAGTPGRRVTAWLGWHVLELTGTGVPIALAVTVNGWWAALAGAVGAGWASHEIQLARRHRALRADVQAPQLTSTNTTEAVIGEDREHD